MALTPPLGNLRLILLNKITQPGRHASWQGWLTHWNLKASCFVELGLGEIAKLTSLLAIVATMSACTGSVESMH